MFGHHPIRSLNSAIADEQAGPCTGPDAHGHGTNPGCDRDPRDSQPIHRGADLQALLHQHPHVIATVFGHTHENKVTAFPRPAAAASGASSRPHTSTGRFSRG